MKIVVPLAGPDFERPDGSVKAEHDLDGQPLLRRGIESRSWWRQGACSAADLTFVLRDTPGSRAFAVRSLALWYPDARVVWLGTPSQGAALSALAGIAAVAHLAEPVCIDLCDILYLEEIEPAALFEREPDCGGVGLAFRSTNPLYSYFRLDANGEVTATAEKQVIGELASAGSYWFRSPSVYCAALAHNLANASAVTFRDLFFVCPVYNGVLASGLKVRVQEVDDVHDIKVLG